MKTAHELLEQLTPLAEDYPQRIEQLTLCAYDLTAEIAELSEQAAEHEAQASAEANGESNEQKRKARRAEILRDDSAYLEIRREIQGAERLRFRLSERAHRYAREFRLLVAREGVRL
jgi:hypothetical protein